jgi:hypothetical protein
VTDDPSNPAPPEDVDRRRFLHRISGEAVSTAGRLAGFSAAVRRSVVAAGQAAAEEIGPPADVPSDAPAETGDKPAVVEPRVLAPKPPPLASPAPLPAPTLTAEQDDLLRRLRLATFAVNDVAGSPHLTAGWFDWDGEVFRVPAGLFTAKANNVARDARVSLLVHDAASGMWLAVTGTAETIAGTAAADAALPLLAKYRPGEDPAVAWRELYPAADGAVIVVRPTRFVWRTS